MNQKKIPTRTRSDAQESRCKDYYKAVINPNSGAVNNYALKGDLRNDYYIFECKCTEKNSISVKKEDIFKLLTQAKLTRKKIILNYEFQKENPHDTTCDLINDPENAFYNLTLVPTSDFIEFYDAKMELNNKKSDVTLEFFIKNIINKCSVDVKDEILYQMQVSSYTCQLNQYKNFIKL